MARKVIYLSMQQKRFSKVEILRLNFAASFYQALVSISLFLPPPTDGPLGGVATVFSSMTAVMPKVDSILSILVLFCGGQIKFF